MRQNWLLFPLSRHFKSFLGGRQTTLLAPPWLRAWSCIRVRLIFERIRYIVFALWVSNYGIIYLRFTGYHRGFQWMSTQWNKKKSVWFSIHNLHSFRKKLFKFSGYMEEKCSFERRKKIQVILNTYFVQHHL